MGRDLSEGGDRRVASVPPSARTPDQNQQLGRGQLSQAARNADAEARRMESVYGKGKSGK